MGQIMWYGNYKPKLDLRYWTLVLLAYLILVFVLFAILTFLFAWLYEKCEQYRLRRRRSGSESNVNFVNDEILNYLP